jgi:hypothetical protein
MPPSVRFADAFSLYRDGWGLPDDLTGLQALDAASQASDTQDGQRALQDGR